MRFWKKLFKGSEHRGSECFSTIKVRLKHPLEQCESISHAYREWCDEHETKVVGRPRLMGTKDGCVFSADLRTRDAEEATRIKEDFRRRLSRQAVGWEE